MYSFCDDNSLDLQCSPIKHTCLSSLHFSFFSFSLKANSSRTFTDMHRLFINAQSRQIPLWITVNRGHAKEVSLPVRSHIPPPVPTISTQATQGLSLSPTKWFWESSCQTLRSTFKTTANFHPLFLKQHSLVAVWHDSNSETVGKTCLYTATTCIPTIRGRYCSENIRFNNIPSGLNTVIILLTWRQAVSSIEAIQPERQLAQQPSVARGPARLRAVSQILE